MNKKNPRSIELFAGAGGLALGLERAGFHNLALNEIDKYAIQTLRKNRKNWNIVEEDIRVLSQKNLLDLWNLKKGELDLLSGGFPCQSFSYAGKKKGLEDVRGTMFHYYSLILEQLMPKMFLAENVKGLINHNKGKTIKTIVDRFTSIGYKVSYKLMNASNHNVAQKRERVFIIGIRSDLYKKNFIFPNGNDTKIVLKDVLKSVPKSDGFKYSQKRQDLFKLIPPGGCWVNLPAELAKEYMGNSYYSGGGKRGVLRRLNWEEPSLTLTCSPIQKQTDRCHPDEIRPLTIREYARIQSFPDEWEFQGSLYSQYKQIGNAVPVNLAFSIGKAIIDFLKEM